MMHVVTGRPGVDRDVMYPVPCHGLPGPAPDGGVGHMVPGPVRLLFSHCTAGWSRWVCPGDAVFRPVLDPEPGLTWARGSGCRWMGRISSAKI